MTVTEYAVNISQASSWGKFLHSLSYSESLIILQNFSPIFSIAITIWT